MAISETFGRSDQHCDPVQIPGFSTWKTERGGTDKGGGGLCIFYKDALRPHCWSPKVPANLDYVKNERQWLLLTNGQERVAFLHIYVACQSHKNDGYLQWNEDLFHLVTTETIKLRRDGFTVLSLGDFNTRVGCIPGLEQNTPDTNRNTPMFLNFITQANLVIINTLPIAQGIFTRFMDSTGRPGSQSVLDYGLIDSEHVHTVTSFVIDQEARHSCGTDHALLFATLEFGARTSVKWRYQEVIQYNFQDNTDFTEFQSSLDAGIATTPLHVFSNLDTDQMLPHLSEKINESGKQCFGLKVRKKKKGLKLPKPILDKIKLKNEIAKQLHHLHHYTGSPNPSHLDVLQQNLSTVKSEIKDLMCDFKLQRRHKLRNKLLLKDPSRKKFWRFLKSQICAAGTITAAYKEEKIVFDQAEIEEAVLDHFGQIFKGQRHPVFVDGIQNDQVTLALQELEEILLAGPSQFQPTHFEAEVCVPFTATELNKILGALPTGKAIGYDGIPHEFLKHSGVTFRQYLLAFLNKIIMDGKVPSTMNIGKCMLIHKVKDPNN